MDKKIRQLITRIKSHLIKLNGEKIKKVILYGSYARGEAGLKRQQRNGDRLLARGAGDCGRGATGREARRIWEAVDC